MKTKVIFLVDESEKCGSEVFAYMPDDIFSFKSNILFCASYCSEGQHAGCSPLYAKDCRYARPEEFKVLYKELCDIGYNLLLTYKI